MGLLDAAIHKHGAATAQIHRHIGKKADLSEFLRAIAENLRKGLQKAATAAGAGLVQKDIIDGSIMNLEAFHVLPADVEDEIHVRLQMLGGIKMGHGFHEAIIKAEGMTNQILAITRDRTGQKLAMRIIFIKCSQIIAHSDHGIALIALVEGIQKLARGTHHGDFDGRAAGVNADKGLLGLFWSRNCYGILLMTLLEFLVCGNIFKKRLHMLKGVCFDCRLQLGRQRSEIHSMLGAEGSAHGHVIKAIFGAFALDI